MMDDLKRFTELEHDQILKVLEACNENLGEAIKVFQMEMIKNQENTKMSDTPSTPTSPVAESPVAEDPDSSRRRLAEERRLAEDDTDPFMASCVLFVTISFGLAVLLMDRYATKAKRDAMQRGQEW